MSTTYNGNPSNISNTLMATVSGAANNGSGLIRITTSAAHYFSTYDTVVVASVGGVPAADGTWTITVIDATHFDLIGSTFSGTYTSGGTAEDISLTPPAQLPSDGEAGTVESIEASIQNLFDRSQFIEAQIATRTGVGTYRLVQELQTGAGASSFTTSYFSAGSWAGQTSFNNANAQLLSNLLSANINDIVELVFASSLAVQATSGGPTDTQANLVLMAQDGGGSLAAAPNAYAARRSSLTSLEVDVSPVTMSSSYKVINGGTQQVYINGCANTGAPNSVACYLAWSLVARVWRPNTV